MGAEAIKAAAAVEKIASVASASMDISLWSNSARTALVLVVLEVVRRLAPLISLCFLVLIGVNLAFFVPHIMEVKKDELDESIGPYIQKAIAFKDKMLAQVPK